MRILLVVTTICLWLVLVPAQSTLIFNVGGATNDSYSSFITSLRDQLKNKHFDYKGIPVMAAPTRPPKYLLVELKANQDISITLCIEKNYLYVVGYSDMYQNKCRSRVFKDRARAEPSLCQGKKDPIREKINYRGSYPQIEARAHIAGGRVKLPLGPKVLETYMEKMYGSEIKNVTEARFLLVAIQMVAETTRFKYIEDLILDKFDDGEVLPNAKVLSLERNWARISRAIRGANDNDGSFKSKLVLRDANNEKWVVTRVDQIAPDLGLLCYEGRGFASLMSLFSRMVRNWVPGLWQKLGW